MEVSCVLCNWVPFFASMVMAPPEMVLAMLAMAAWDGVRQLPVAARWILAAGIGLVAYAALRYMPLPRFEFSAIGDYDP